MTPAQHQRAKDLFVAVASLPPKARGSFLAQSGDDLEVLAEVERLLRAETVPGDSLGVVGRALAGGAAAHQSRVGHSIAHYTVERLLGAGGMGEVYLARDRALGRAVALKILPADFHPALRERLLREAWASARVQHPGIATFYDAGHVEDADYIAMEYVAGQTLRDRLGTGRLPVSEGLAIAAGLLEALVHAHHAGVIHRDIKPENIVLTADGRPKLLDFGLAKGLVGDGAAAANRIDTDSATLAMPAPAPAPPPRGSDPQLRPDDLTGAGEVMGTLGYMAPEQIRGQIADQRADVFAVGAVLYEMFSGARAFPGGSRDERVTATLSRDPDPLTALDLPPGLEHVVRRALARQPGSRYPTASAFLAALREIGGERARSTHPASLAVMDIRHPADDPALGLLATALAESLTGMLRRAVGIGIVPPARLAALGPGLAETLTPAEIGLRLGCSAVLLGTLQGGGDRVTLAAELHDVASACPLVVDSLSGDPGQVAASLERLAAAVAEALGAGPPGRTERPSLEAATLCARGRRLALGHSRNAIEEARDLLERAVALEPNYSAAWTGVAMVRAFRGNFDRNPNNLMRAVECGQRAIALDPTLADAYVWAGYALSHLDRGRESGAMFRRAMELDPSAPLAPYFRTGALFGARRFEDIEDAADPGDPPLSRDNWWRWRNHKAIELYRRAIELAPALGMAWLGLGWFLADERQFDEARWCIGRAIELEPRSFPPVTGTAGYLGECLLKEGRLAEARVQFLRGLDSLERTDHMYRDTFRALFLSGLGRTALMEGDRDAASATFQQAVLHLDGRPMARCGGQAMVQALAGLARASGDGAKLDEATRFFYARQGFDFGPLWGLTDAIALWELHLAAMTLGRRQQADELLGRAREAGSTDAHRYGA